MMPQMCSSNTLPDMSPIHLGSSYFATHQSVVSATSFQLHCALGNHKLLEPAGMLHHQNATVLLGLANQLQ